MTTIHIAASREYDVVIEPGLLTRLGTMAAELGLGRRAAVISDDAVFALYGAAAEKALTDAGFQVDHFLFPHGEQQKNLSTYGQVLNFLCDRRFTRSDFLVGAGRRRGGGSGRLRRRHLSAGNSLYSGTHHAAVHGGFLRGGQDRRRSGSR